MKLSRILFAAVVLTSLTLTSCQTTKNDDNAGGISGQGLGQTRQDVYRWQDQTFRSLGYN
ncbi:MAG: hypothetical protein CMO55_08690 [Verrucomicrobiales bacterium]|nr:hypothetical protein [Verrucomicrobiales bacterium]